MVIVAIACQPEGKTEQVQYQRSKNCGSHYNEFETPHKGFFSMAILKDNERMIMKEKNMIEILRTLTKSKKE